jgi:hypothetical protein
MSEGGRGVDICNPDGTVEGGFLASKVIGRESGQVATAMRMLNALDAITNPGDDENGSAFRVRRGRYKGWAYKTASGYNIHWDDGSYRMGLQELSKAGVVRWEVGE